MNLILRSTCFFSGHLARYQRDDRLRGRPQLQASDRRCSGHVSWRDVRYIGCSECSAAQQNLTTAKPQHPLRIRRAILG